MARPPLGRRRRQRVVRPLRQQLPADRGSAPRPRPRGRRARVPAHVTRHGADDDLPPQASRPALDRRPAGRVDLGRHRAGGRHPDRARAVRVAQLSAGRDQGVVLEPAQEAARNEAVPVRLHPPERNRRGAERKPPRLGTEHARGVRGQPEDRKDPLAARRQEEHVPARPGRQVRVAARRAAPAGWDDHGVRQRCGPARAQVHARARDPARSAGQPGDARAELPPSEEIALAVRGQCAVPPRRPCLRRLGRVAVRQRAQQERAGAVRRVLRARQAARRGC